MRDNSKAFAVANLHKLLLRARYKQSSKRIHRCTNLTVFQMSKLLESMLSLVYLTLTLPPYWFARTITFIDNLLNQTCDALFDGTHEMLRRIQLFMPHIILCTTALRQIMMTLACFLITQFIHVYQRRLVEDESWVHRLIILGVICLSDWVNFWISNKLVVHRLPPIMREGDWLGLLHEFRCIIHLFMDSSRGSACVGFWLDHICEEKLVRGLGKLSVWFGVPKTRKRTTWNEFHQNTRVKERT